MHWRRIEGIFVLACVLSIGGVVVHRAWRGEHPAEPQRPVERQAPAARSPEVVATSREESSSQAAAQTSTAIIAEVRTLCEMFKQEHMTVEKLAAHLGTAERPCEPYGGIDIHPRSPLFESISIGCPEKGKHPENVDLILSTPHVLSLETLRRTFGEAVLGVTHHPGDPDRFIFRLPRQPGGDKECSLFADMQIDSKVALEMDYRVSAELDEAGITGEQRGFAFAKEMGRRLNGMVEKLSMRLD